MAYELRILNTIFQKGTNHRITYSSGGEKHQIDYMKLIDRKEHARESNNYEVGPNYTIIRSNLTTRNIISFYQFPSY